jgi:hypothetical protein
MNALDHGFRANILVLPTEEFGDYQNLLGSWYETYRPRNQNEEFLVESFVALRFKMKRIDRAQTARLSARIINGDLEAADNEEKQVITLAQRLFQGAGAAAAAEPKPKATPPEPLRDARGPLMTTRPIDPDDPKLLVNDLERNQTGCAWLLEQWDALRSLLDQDLVWLPSDTLKAVRLLGRRPAEAVDWMEVARLYLASHVLRNGTGNPFQEILNDLAPDQAPRYTIMLMQRNYEVQAPKDAAAAKQALLEVVDRAIESLEERAEALRERAEAIAPYNSARLSWDDTPEGERLRRYEMTCQRTMWRVQDSLWKLRSSRTDVDRATFASIAHSVPTVKLEDWMTDRPAPTVADVTTPPVERVAPPAAPNEAKSPQAGGASNCATEVHPPSPGPAGHLPPTRGEGDAPNEANSAHASAPNEANSHLQAPSSKHHEGHRELRVDTPHVDCKPGAIGTTNRKPSHPALERVLGGKKPTLLDLSPIFGER